MQALMAVKVQEQMPQDTPSQSGLLRPETADRANM